MCHYWWTFSRQTYCWTISLIYKTNCFIPSFAFGPERPSYFFGRSAELHYSVLVIRFESTTKVIHKDSTASCTLNVHVHVNTYTVSFMFCIRVDRLLEWQGQTGSDPRLSAASKRHVWHGKPHSCSHYHHGKRPACSRQHTHTHTRTYAHTCSHVFSNL